MMRMSVSVISVYRISYRYQLILLLNIGYRNNRLIWISVQHYEFAADKNYHNFENGICYELVTSINLFIR